MPLPHDYVNYIKLTSVDSNGIEHIIYPTRHTSMPFAINQSDGCAYDVDEDGSLLHQQDCVETAGQICDPACINEWFQALITYDSTTRGRREGGYNDTITFTICGEEHTGTYARHLNTLTGLIDDYCACLHSIDAEEQCGERCSSGWEGLKAALFPDTISIAGRNIRRRGRGRANVVTSMVRGTLLTTGSNPAPNESWRGDGALYLEGENGGPGRPSGGPSPIDPFEPRDPRGPSGEVDGWVDADSGNDGYWEVGGCTDPSACNYNAEATIDDGSCWYAPDCEDPRSQVYGCTDPNLSLIHI